MGHLLKKGRWHQEKGEIKRTKRLGAAQKRDGDTFSKKSEKGLRLKERDASTDAAQRLTRPTRRHQGISNPTRIMI